MAQLKKPRINYILQINAYWDKVANTSLRATAGIVYFCLLQRNNNHDWKEEFTVDYEKIMDLCSISKNTYYDCIKELVEKGFITHTRQENRALLSKISIIILYQNLVYEQDKTCDTNQDTTCDSSSTLIKPLNNKPKNNKIDDDPLFDQFWELYSKKVGRDKSLIKWMTLSESVKIEIIKTVPDYVKSEPDKKYRKNPLTYLNGGHWKDEIIIATPTTPLTMNTTLFKLGAKPSSSVRH